tara:strand:+ start:12939 stop:13169 length:231 start_codon:yes stop_codon:yes gene_type:complete
VSLTLYKSAQEILLKDPSLIKKPNSKHYFTEMLYFKPSLLSVLGQMLWLKIKKYCQKGGNFRLKGSITHFITGILK